MNNKYRNVVFLSVITVFSIMMVSTGVEKAHANTEFDELWIVLSTGYLRNAGTNAQFSLAFDNQSIQDVILPNEPGDDNERYYSTTYNISVQGISLEDFRNGVVLKHNNSGPGPGWFCEAVLILGHGTDGKWYPVVAMPDVNQWLATNHGTIQLELNTL